MTEHTAVIQLAKEGVEIHGKTDPEYIVCAEVLRLHEVNQDLLEALSELSEFCKELGFSWSCLAQAQAAIAKAEVQA